MRAGEVASSPALALVNIMYIARVQVYYITPMGEMQAVFVSFWRS